EVEDYCVNIIDPNACDPPTMLTRTDASPTTVSLEWPDVPNAESYLFRYRPTATTAWTSLTTADNTLSLNDLDTCATFEVSIQSNCATGTSNFSELFSFNTFCVSSISTVPAPNQLEVFPNPFRETLNIRHISAKAGQTINLAINRVDGTQVAQITQVFDGDSMELSLGAYPAGVYFIQLFEADQAIGWARVIKL
ncbi:MAG: T9SS type A sorting domain-containing protein, partial [Bacteroidota bacterium]